MKKFASILLIIMLISMSCQKEKLADEWTISGKIMQTDTGMPQLQSPLPDVPVYLVQLEAKRDTLTSWYQPEDIVDSTATDAAGQYSFSSVSKDNYLVMPKETNPQWQFDWSDSPDSIWITEDSDQTEFEINFTTPEPSVENSSYFRFRFENSSYDIAYTPQISIFRVCRTWEYKGWDWGPVFGWSDWYWDRRHGCMSGYCNDFSDLERMYSKDASWGAYQYKDEFYIKFHVVDTGIFDEYHWLKTIRVAGDDLKENNRFEVRWGPGDYEVTVKRVDW